MNAKNESQSPSRSVAVREEFGARTATALTEIASSGISAAAVAAVQAQYIMALQRPRDLMKVRERLLEEVSHPVVAAKAEWELEIWNSKTGKKEKINGLSIRFAECALRALGNVRVSTIVLEENETRRTVRVTVNDLESNYPYERDVTTEKTIERRKLYDDEEPISERFNSNGEKVYLVKATESAWRSKEASHAARVIRDGALKIMPVKVREDARDAARDVRAKGFKEDPQKAVRTLVDTFAELGVKVGDLEDLVGHTLETLKPEEYEQLRSVAAALEDGATTWTAILESAKASGANGATESTGQEEDEQKTPAPPPKSKLAASVDAARAALAGGVKSEPVSDLPKPELPKPLSAAERRDLVGKVRELLGMKVEAVNEAGKAFFQKLGKPWKFELLTDDEVRELVKVLESKAGGAA